MTRYRVLTEHRTQSASDGFETTRPKRKIPKPVLHETEAETETNYCETELETETKKWSRHQPYTDHDISAGYQKNANVK